MLPEPKVHWLSSFFFFLRRTQVHSFQRLREKNGGEYERIIMMFAEEDSATLKNQLWSFLLYIYIFLSWTGAPAYFHGTPVNRVSSILMHGLRPSNVLSLWKHQYFLNAPIFLYTHVSTILPLFQGLNGAYLLEELSRHLHKPYFWKKFNLCNKDKAAYKTKSEKRKIHTHIYIYMHIYDCFPPGWHQNLQDNINFLRIAKQSSGRSHDKTKKACVFMYESSFCLHPPRLDEICVYLEVTWSQRFAKAEESKRSLKRRKTWESQVPFQIFFSEQSLFYQKHVENTLVYKMIEKKDPIFLTPQQALFSSAGHRSMKEVHACTLRLWRSNKKAKTWQLFTESQSFCCCFGTTNITTMGLTGSTEDIAVWVEHFCGQDWKVISRQNLLQLLLNSFLFFQPYCFLCM